MWNEQTSGCCKDPITIDELLNTVRKGKSRKSEAQDGISNVFYRMTWNTINQDMMDVMNLMYMNGSVTGAQKSGTIVCLPKNQIPEVRRNTGRSHNYMRIINY